MNAYQKDETALRSLKLLNIFLLSVHASLLVFFAVLGVRLMAYFNVVSVSYYISAFFLLKFDKSIMYTFFTFVEMMIHMLLAVICTGWGAGFQLYFIGCALIVFYADYFSVRLGKRSTKGGVYCAISAALYLISLMVTRQNEAIYDLSEGLALMCLIVNSLVIFLFAGVFFGMLVNRAAYFEKQLGYQATHDKLTGMVNRRYLVDQLDKIYAEQDMSSYWIAILDIDDFKGINDKFGHLCGDFVLKSMAEMIKEICGDRTVCRWGGEEFLIVGSDGEPDQTGRRVESLLLERIRHDIAAKDFVYDDKTTINMTVTIGTAHYQEGQTVDAWINVADSRLYYGKQTGKNKVVETDK